MNSKEIRTTFLEYFREKGHETVRSSNLIPAGDRSLLFTNAGMVQFKSLFLGEEKRDYTRAATCQKCMRAGGKQSDIENVGLTARHHTFFEMLGNFSFGDYFKRDAIIFAWELLTERYKLPVEKLWVTVFRDDDEAAALWPELTGISEERIVRLDEKDNFWRMGDTGPCGPCSEIIIDQGEALGCGREDCAVGCDCDRYLELWNLVFMQFDSSEAGELTPLPSPSIDTGMGLERLTAVMQGKSNNFDTDLFVPIIDVISSKLDKPYGKNNSDDISLRVIADHIRTITFLLSENLMPSNEKRGYVLRRIIRRAMRYTKKMGIDEPFLHTLIDPVIEATREIYPEVDNHKKGAVEILKFEEESFLETFEKGLFILEDIKEGLKKSNSTIISGTEVFKLYDTFGFPPENTEEIAGEEGLKIDWDGFHREMDAQRARARVKLTEKDFKINTPSDRKTFANILKKTGKTDFRGYENLETASVVLCLMKDNETTNELKEGDHGEAILDITPFYGESGGQVGDRGKIDSNDMSAVVSDVKKTPDNLFIHSIKIEKGVLKLSDQVTCHVKRDDRKAVMRNHTATHLLHAALRNVLGEHIKQAGSLVEPERLRFDFTHFSPLSGQERGELSRIVNEKILESISVRTRDMALQEAVDSGATALFDEKYGDKVRVVGIGDFSKELCGGTHCERTSDIGSFTILSENGIASGVRRIEALTGANALSHFEKNIEKQREIADYLKTEDPLEKIKSMAKRIRSLEKELEHVKIKGGGNDLSTLLDNVRIVKGAKIIVARNDNLGQKELRGFADGLRDKIGSGVVFVTAVRDGQALFVSMVTKDLAGKFNAGNIVKEISVLAGGKGGGRPDMAQGGTKDLDKLDAALKKIYEVV